MKTVKLQQKNLNSIIGHLENGGVIICPTDTIYGFLADAGNKKAVDKIYKIKKRPKSKPLAVFVGDFKMANLFAKIDEKQAKVLKSKWPGKFTFVLPREKIKLYDGGKNTIALRIPKYKFLNVLLKKIKNFELLYFTLNLAEWLAY